MAVAEQFEGVKTYEEIEAIADWLKEKTHYRPMIGIICGSGLGTLAETLENPHSIEYKDIPSFPVSTVQGHIGRLVFGTISSVPVVVMQGRFHHYEGYSMHSLSIPVRVMKLVGIQILIVTNAAGGVNEEYEVGDVMFLKDHVAFPLMQDNPLKGHNDIRFGQRFVSLHDCYCPKLRKLAKEVSMKYHKNRFYEGVYFMQCGPHYESVAELKIIKSMNADAVGMSTVPEALVARHCGLKVFAFSLITNKCNLEYDDKGGANHKEVLEAGRDNEAVMKDFVKNIIIRFNDEIII